MVFEKSRNIIINHIYNILMIYYHLQRRPHCLCGSPTLPSNQKIPISTNNDQNAPAKTKLAMPKKDMPIYPYFATAATKFPLLPI